MKAYGGVDVQIHIFLISALAGGSQFYAPSALPPGKELPVPHSRSGRREEEKTLDPTRTQTPTSRSSSP
jgi:hypothetical protein